MSVVSCAPSKLLSEIHYRLPHLSHVRFGGNFTDGSLSETLPGEIVVNNYAFMQMVTTRLATAIDIYATTNRASWMAPAIAAIDIIIYCILAIGPSYYVNITNYNIAVNCRSMLEDGLEFY